MLLGMGLEQEALMNIVMEEDIRPEVFGHLCGLFRSKTKAVEALREVVQENRVCARVIGLENGKSRGRHRHKGSILAR